MYVHRCQFHLVVAIVQLIRQQGTGHFKIKAKVQSPYCNLDKVYLRPTHRQLNQWLVIHFNELSLHSVSKKTLKIFIFVICMTKSVLKNFPFHFKLFSCRVTSAFDENKLNVGRFISLMENFLTDECPREMVSDLVEYIQEGYIETEEEKMSRLAKVS